MVLAFQNTSTKADRSTAAPPTDHQGFRKGGEGKRQGREGDQRLSTDFSSLIFQDRYQRRSNLADPVTEIIMSLLQPQMRNKEWVCQHPVTATKISSLNQMGVLGFV